MHPCLSPNNLFYIVLRCQSVKCSSSIPSPKLMKAKYPSNPFPLYLVKIIRTTFVGANHRCGGVAQPPAWLMHHRWAIHTYSKISSKTQIYPCPHCEAMIGDSHPNGEKMSQNLSKTLSNFSSKILGQLVTTMRPALGAMGHKFLNWTTSYFSYCSFKLCLCIMV